VTVPGHPTVPGGVPRTVCGTTWHDGAVDAPGEEVVSGTDAGAESGATDETPAATEMEIEMASRLRLVVGRLNRRIRIDGRESVPPLQLSAMVTVEELGPLRLSELARREAVSVPTMSRVLAALDEQQLVVRTPDPQDARSALVTLSEEGARRLAQVRSHRTALVARRLRRLDAAQRAALAAALPALEALLVDEAPPD
jgi:DNA-binding MarR family transcriptional regulator